MCLKMLTLLLFRYGQAIIPDGSTRAGRKASAAWGWGAEKHGREPSLQFPLKGTGEAGYTVCVG